MHFCGKVSANIIGGLVCSREGVPAMTFEDFDRKVRLQIQARTQVIFPDDWAIQVAEMFYKEDLEDIRADTTPQCAALAIRIALQYRQEQTDTGQPTTPPRRERVVSNAEVPINALVVQYREERFNRSDAPFPTVEAAQACLAGLSAGDTLLSFSRDMASATKTTPASVAMTVLAGQPLVHSAGNIGKVTYSVAMHRSGTAPLQWPTIEALTGHLLAHTFEGWRAPLRQEWGHTPRQHVRTEEDEEHDRALHAFVNAQKREWGWFQGRMPNGFWPLTWQAWNKQCTHLGRLDWQYNSNDALRRAHDRLPDDRS